MNLQSRPDRPRLSLCMIVRDAERTIARALASVRPFVDELIVVDTGSSDRTRALAMQGGAQVFNFRWCDDFSAARNCSLERATGDWILWMDADDELLAESGPELQILMAGCPDRDAAFWITVEEVVAQPRGRSARVVRHAHAKLLPRHPAIRFRYRIHEQVAPAIRELGLPIRRSSVIVRHLADRSAAAEAARSDRNLRLALLDLDERPNDPFVWLTVGSTYLFREDGLPKAIDFLRRSANALKPGSPNQLNAWLYLGQALGTSGDRKQEEQIYRDALQTFTDDAVLLNRLAALCERSGRWSEAVDCYRTLLERGKLRWSSVHEGGVMERAAVRCGEILVQSGHRARAERLWAGFLKRCPQAADVREALHKSYLNSCAVIVGPQS